MTLSQVSTGVQTSILRDLLQAFLVLSLMDSMKADTSNEWELSLPLIVKQDQLQDYREDTLLKGIQWYDQREVLGQNLLRHWKDETIHHI